MAKRHHMLISLSHDHHLGLALAVRLQQGGKALLTDGWTHDRGRQALKVAEFHRKELSVHFRLEEEVLFPAILKLVRGCAPLVENLLSQHRQMENTIGVLPMLQGAALETSLVDFGGLLERHIRLEERTLFPACEKQLPPDAAREIGKSLDRLRDLLRSPGRAGREQ